MAVNSYLICEKLKGYKKRKLAKCTTECKIRFVMVYHPEIPLKEDTVYLVVDSNMLPMEVAEKNCLFIVLGELEKSVLESLPYECICMDSHYGLGKLYEAVMEILEEYRKWEEDLEQMMLKGTGLHELCAATVSIFQNPLRMIDRNFELIGIGENETYRYHTSIREGDSDFLSDQWVMHALGCEKNIFDRKGPFEFHYAEDFTTLLFNIFDEKQFVAQVGVDAVCRKMVLEDYIRICIFANKIQLYLKYKMQNRVLAKNRLRSQMTDYMKGAENKDALAVSISKRNWNLTDSYICISIYNDSMTGNEMLMEKYQNIWETVIPDCVCFHGKRLCALHHVGDSFEEEKLPERLAEAANTYQCMIGISFLFRNFYEFRDFYAQAEAARETGVQYDPAKAVYVFDEYKVKYIIKNGVEALPFNTLMTDGLRQLKDYDIETDSELCKTLRIYLKNNLNVTETVNKLYIHRSTFQYRLQRIREIMGTDLTDSKEQLYLRMLLFEMSERGDLREKEM